MNISPQLMTTTSTLHLHHLLKKCSSLKQLNQIHSYFITTGILQVDPRLLGRLFFFSATSDSADIHYASLLFSQLHHPNIFFYNTMIKAHSRTTSPQNSISIYTQILRSGLLPDIYTFPLLLKACTQQVPFFPQGRSVHGQAIKFALDSYIYVNNSLIHFYSVNEQINNARKLFDTCKDLDIVSWNSIISAYVRAGSIDNAKNLFDQMPERNSISWSALISGYVQCGLSREALGVFERMQVELVKINEITLVSVLSACAHLGALEQGKWVHGYLKSNRIEVSVFLGTSLIDMYAKCGEVELALEVFNGMKERNLLAWTTMIKGLAMHGRGRDALDLFLNMEKAGIKPDDITFIGVLCACTHAGLIDQGCQIFNSMSSDYGIDPKIEHYGCMVDLLARGGRLMEARLMVESMPIKPDALIWGALMAGCRFYRNVELAEFVVKRLIQLEPYNGGVYVLLSNIYAASGRQEDAKKVRRLMEMKGVLKTAGCSSIEIGGTLHQFIVGDTSHPQIRKILVKWEEIERFLNLEGYVPNKTEVLLDIDEEDKEEALARHSEKLAIAFGLLSTEDGVPIRIVKNLRVCSDCHLVTKLISRIYNREIVVRDRTRFHLFKDGKCSCKDYWFLAFRNIRKAAHSFLANQRTRYSEVNWHGGILTAGMSPSIYKFSSRRQVTLALYSVKQKEIMCRCSKNFSVLSASKTMTHHAQVAWKRLFQICSYSGPAYPPISRIACAVSLALTRSHLVAPSIISFIIGEVAWTQKTWADAGNFSTRDTRYMDIEERRLCLISFISSIAEVFILFLRAVYLTIIFSPTLAMAPFADCLGVQFRKAWLQLVHLTLEQAGPAFIKWGQWAATRPDLFPNDLCTELTKLHSNAPTHSFAHTKRTIEKAFGRMLSELFESFEETPLASGSVAQVHRATLRFRYPGQKTKSIEVAVKVRHPGVGEAIRRDFVLIDFAAKISKFIPTLKWLRLDESVQQFAVFMMSQVDLAREAAHLNRFIHNFRRWKDVSFPEPLYPLVHPAVLVETYEHGESVSHFVDELEGNDRIKSALAHIGTHALLKMLLVDNFIHADMHPGNILVRVGQSKSARKQFKSKPHVVFLDVGMTAELSKSDRVNILEFFKAVALRDGRTAAECTLRLSKQQKCPNPKAFIKEVEETFSFWDTTDGDGIHPADCMQQLLEKVRRHRVNIDGNVCTVMVTTLVLEGWQRKLDPDYDVMETLKTLLFRADWAETLSYTIEGLMAP